MALGRNAAGLLVGRWMIVPIMLMATAAASTGELTGETKKNEQVFYGLMQCPDSHGTIKTGRWNSVEGRQKI